MDDVDAGRHPEQIHSRLEQQVGELLQEPAGILISDGVSLKPCQHGREADGSIWLKFPAKVLIVHRRNSSQSNKRLSRFFAARLPQREHTHVRLTPALPACG